MRYALIALVCIFSYMAQAGLKIEDAYLQAENELKAIRELKTFDEKKKKVLIFQTSLDKALEAWEKETPQEASKDEEPVSLFFYTLQPVFDLAEKSKKSELHCANAELAIKSAAAQGKPEDAPLSKNSRIALDWVAALCK